MSWSDNDGRPAGTDRGDLAVILADFGADGSELDAAVPGRPAAGVCAGAWIQPALNSSSVCGGGLGGAMGGGCAGRPTPCR